MQMDDKFDVWLEDVRKGSVSCWWGALGCSAAGRCAGGVQRYILLRTVVHNSCSSSDTSTVQCSYRATIQNHLSILWLSWNHGSDHVENAFIESIRTV